MTATDTPASVDEHEVVVVGAGFAGIASAIKLDELGFHDYLVLEEGHGVGGTWYWNHYPGVAVDIPSFSYQYSFAPRPDWTRVYAPGDELRGYANDVVDRYGVRDRIRFGTLVTSAVFDEVSDRWRLRTGNGDEVIARHVVLATGAISRPKPVTIDGIDDFAGTTVHTARWNDTLDLRDKRVAVIGTGASAVQVIPAIAGAVAHLTVFQRTPIWCLPKPDSPIPAAVRRLFARVPGIRRSLRWLSQAYVELQFPLAIHYSRAVPTAAIAERAGRWMLKHQVKDPVLREKLTPRYTLGCKRPAFHNSYLKTYERSNVTLETTAISRITPTGVETVDGTHHEVDVIVLATGFKVFESGSMPPFPTQGTDGMDLDTFWAEQRYQAYHGVSVPKFPNFHIIFGPYGYNVASYFTLIENQLRHIGRLLGEARQRGASRVEVTSQANARFFASMQGRRHRQLLVRGNCAPANSYYFDRNGDSPFRAAPTAEVQWTSTRFPLTDYSFATASTATGLPGRQETIPVAGS
jgi:cation diffusion facilitator CzcD-associated flavoprotein CzcO